MLFDLSAQRSILQKINQISYQVNKTMSGAKAQAILFCIVCFLIRSVLRRNLEMVDQQIETMGICRFFFAFQ